LKKKLRNPDEIDPEKEPISIGYNPEKAP